MLNQKNIVGHRVRQARLSQSPRLTQAALAARMQVAGFQLERGAIAKIEIGYREVNDRELLGLARALSVSVSWLVGEVE